MDAGVGCYGLLDSQGGCFIIQSLFPDEYSICSQEYVVKLDETVLLSCSICGQGIHPRCLAQKIGVAEVDVATLTAEDIRMKVNPCGLQTLIYLCGPLPQQRSHHLKLA